MVKKIYAIYDVKAGYYTPPFVANNDQDAMRQIAITLMTSPTIPPAMYPEDYYLHQIAKWNEVTGDIASDNSRLVSCEWILHTFQKKSSAGAEDKKEETENA